ncbi:MAG TPA: hypothetical protein VM120_20955 [Bryobacteraceae bacterium]|nr:hypothetical protein [Bryobacteraceae bacterium]
MTGALEHLRKMGFADLDEALAVLSEVTLGELPDNSLAVVLLFNSLAPEGQLRVLHYVRDLKMNGGNAH